MQYESICKFVTGPVRALVCDRIEPNITRSSIAEYDDRLLTPAAPQTLHKRYFLCPSSTINQNHLKNMNSSVDDSFEEISNVSAHTLTINSSINAYKANYNFNLPILNSNIKTLIPTQISKGRVDPLVAFLARNVK